MVAVSMDPDMLVEIIRSRKPFVTALIRTFKRYSCMKTDELFLLGWVGEESLTFFQSMDGSNMPFQVLRAFEDLATAIRFTDKHL